MASAKVAYGSEAARDAFRGLYISQHQVDQALSRKPGTPTLEAGQEPEPFSLDLSDESSRLAWLASTFGLSPFDVDIVLIALGPELDLKYERIYGYLQDDVTRKRPTVDLALNMLCPDAEAKLARRGHFATNAPLIRNRLVNLVADPTHVQPPILAHYLKLDDQVIRLLLGHDDLDPRLAPFCEKTAPTININELFLGVETKRGLRVLARQARNANQPLRLYFHGPHGVGKRQAAEAVASELGMPLLTADLERALLSNGALDLSFKLLLRETWFQNAVVYIAGLDALRSRERVIQYQQLLRELAEDGGITILAGTQPWASGGSTSKERPLDIVSVSFPDPDFAQRQLCWESSLAQQVLSFDGQGVDGLASRFRLVPAQIAQAVNVAQNSARWRAATRAAEDCQAQPETQLGIRDLFAAARTQSGHDLASLAQKIEPRYRWDDIVLPEDTVAQLREICQRVAHRRRVLGDWGFEQKLSLGKGVNALFAGPSGTGKTMAAEVITSDLELDMYKINLSQVVSKYVGETEKNLDRIFRAAENSNAILFFDEADALFGKRSEVRDSHDRYANIEISYLLQKIEEYDGIAILATNLWQNLDESFIRRLAFTVHFPFPDEASRRRIWSGIWPSETPLDDSVDLDFLAHRFKLSGGNIKNIALAAAFLTAEDGGAVTMAQLLHATRREYQKMGKALSDDELGVSQIQHNYRTNTRARR